MRVQKQVATLQQRKWRKEGKKWCAGCQHPHLLSEFYNNRSAVDGKQSICKGCVRMKYSGWTRAEYEATYKEQNGRCAICHSSHEVLCADHCHATGKRRELLCTHCNTALGFFEDDVVLMRRAIKYIEKHTYTCKTPHRSRRKI